MLEKQKHKINVLFVCLGNICRSPCADGLMQYKVKMKGLTEKINIDSAGTGAWHIGQKPDVRMINYCAKQGLDINYLRARQFLISDFYEFDYIYAMDRYNLADLQNIKPGNSTAKLELFLQAGKPKKEIITLNYEVPDPYYDGKKGFELVYKLIDYTTDQILAKLIETIQK